MKTMIGRIGGVTAVMAGLYLLVMAGVLWFGSGDIDDYPVVEQSVTLMPIMLIGAAAGLYALAGQGKGLRLGAILIGLGAALMAAGFGLMTWFENENGWGLMILGVVVHPIGILWYGLDNRRPKVLPRWNEIPLALGMVTSLLVAVSVAGDGLGWNVRVGELLFGVYVLSLGIGWTSIGGAILLGGRDGRAAATAAV